jgi:hypothetical protein
MLTNIYDIENIQEIEEELIELLKQFDKDLNSYDTDVYLYYDEDTNTATLDTFVNPGGNSWLDDDHYTIYTDKQRYDSFMDWYNGDLMFIADCLNKTVEELYDEYIVANELDEDDIEYVGDNEVIEYVESVDKYYDILYNYYCEEIDDNYSNYLDTAEHILDEFNEDIIDSDF